MKRDNSNRLKHIIDRLSPEDGKYICKVIYRDPFSNIYSILLILYVFILVAFLLWPFDFFVKNDARWIGNSEGIEFLKVGQAISNSSNQEFFDRLVNGRGLALEVWLQTENLHQDGLAMILSFSKDTESRNFTIGQAQHNMVVRLRTTETNLNGMNPHLFIINTFNDKNPRYIVIVYDFNEERVYINGVQKARSNTLKGNFSNWDTSCKLVIGNEVTGIKPWKGKIYYVAIFNRPLTKQEIRENYLSGVPHKTNTRPPVKLSKGNINRSDIEVKGPVARYFFDEGKGHIIHDSGSDLSPVNLFIPKYIENKVEPFFDISMDYLKKNFRPSDIILNILIFIPLGILIHGMLRTRYGATLKISLITLLAGTLFSISIESLQHFSMTRDSSLIDVFTNMSGVAIGIVIGRFYNHFLIYKTIRP